MGLSLLLFLCLVHVLQDGFVRLTFLFILFVILIFSLPSQQHVKNQFILLLRHEQVRVTLGADEQQLDWLVIVYHLIYLVFFLIYIRLIELLWVQKARQAHLHEQSDCAIQLLIYAKELTIAFRLVCLG